MISAHLDVIQYARWSYYCNNFIIIMFLSFRTDRSGQTVQTLIRGAFLSGSILFAIYSASVGCITLRKSHLIQLLGWLLQIFGYPKFNDFYGICRFCLFFLHNYTRSTPKNAHTFDVTFRILTALVADVIGLVPLYKWRLVTSLQTQETDVS